MPNPPESKAEAEALLPQFQPTHIINQDQSGRRISLLGTIQAKQGLLILERASFPSSDNQVPDLLASLTATTNLGANDIYRWYMSNSTLSPNVKVNIIWPATDSHVRKYTAQKLRWVLETPEIYTKYVAPWVESQRGGGRVDWIYNILDGRTEQEDVVWRSNDHGFLMLPDLNWDRSTVGGLHLLALVQRRDLASLRSLKKRDVSWLKGLRDEVVSAAAAVAKKLGSQDTEVDQFKCYVHYQPTYYHFHVHVVHVMLEAGATQAVGKAIGLDHLITMLDILSSEEQGLESVEIGYYLGEESDLWKKLFSKLKAGQEVVL